MIFCFMSPPVIIIVVVRKEIRSSITPPTHGPLTHIQLKFIVNRLTPGHTQGKEKEIKKAVNLDMQRQKKEISNDGIM